VDSEGQSYVVDGTFNCYQIFNEKGQVLTFVGVGGWGGGGLFMSPSGLYIDENDKIYVVDVLNKRVQVFQYLSEKWKKEHPEEYTKYQAKSDKMSGPDAAAPRKRKQSWSMHESYGGHSLGRCSCCFFSSSPARGQRRTLPLPRRERCGHPCARARGGDRPVDPAGGLSRERPAQKRAASSGSGRSMT